MSRNDLLVVGWLSIASGRLEKVPNKTSDSLGVVGPSVEGGRGEETTNESSRLVGGWLAQHCCRPNRP